MKFQCFAISLLIRFEMPFDATPIHDFGCASSAKPYTVRMIEKDSKKRTSVPGNLSKLVDDAQISNTISKDSMAPLEGNLVKEMD